MELIKLNNHLHKLQNKLLRYFSKIERMEEVELVGWIQGKDKSDKKKVKSHTTDFIGSGNFSSTDRNSPCERYIF